MTVQEFPENSQLSSLTTKAVASISAYEAAKTEKARHDALEAATRLVRALEEPSDAIYKLFASVWPGFLQFSYLVLISGTKACCSNGH